MPYTWSTENNRIIRKLKQSLSNKKKYEWTKSIGPKFAAEDISTIRLVGRRLRIMLLNGHVMQVLTLELNYRETEEALRFAEKKVKG